MTQLPIAPMDFFLFANANNLSERELRYRVQCGQVDPMPEKDRGRWLFNRDAVIVVPPPKKPPGRPKGSLNKKKTTPKKRGYPRARTVKKKSK